MKSLILLTFLASSMAFAETKTFNVGGMTCGACVKAVRKAVCEDMKFPKENCEVKIGTLKVTADKIDVAAIESAVKAEGYELVAAAPATPAKKESHKH